LQSQAETGKDSEMINHGWKATILAVLLLGKTASTPADELGFPGRSGTWAAVFNSSPTLNAMPPQPAVQDGKNVVALPGTGPAMPFADSAYLGPGQAVNGSWAVGSLPVNVIPAPPSQQTPAAYGRSPTPNSPPLQSATQYGSGAVALPGNGRVTPGGGSVSSASPEPGQAVDGTWREEGLYVIVNINGIETRLLKQAPEVSQSAAASQPTQEGTVRGRLAQGKRPLTNCHVVIVPMNEEGQNAYAYSKAQEPLTAITDSDGVYYFEHVPAGQYKLTWLPQGTNQWIRRLAIKPDLVVHGGEAVSVKEIRGAQTTIN
jgi:hypothetical protein